MEDEDVDSVNKFSDPVVEKKKTDGPVIVSSDAKNVVPSENNSGSHSEEEEEENKVTKDDRSSNIDRLKNALINHDAINVNRCIDNEDICAHLSSPSPKKINGEVNKTDSVISSEESCDYEKNNDENIVEDINIDENLEKEAICSSIEGSDKRKRSSDRSNESDGSENGSSNESSSGSSPIEFRGFKRRKIFESGAGKAINSTEVNTPMEIVNSDVADEPEKPKSLELRRSARNASIAKRQSSEAIIRHETKEESGDQLTEYAQYLGLQPTVKFKCGRCGEKHFQSMASLNTHQMICCKTTSNAHTKQIIPPSDSNISTNFRITRKVYLCSACGTYYENWKLFLHMRDMHKRHICLFCLGMFSVAERLAEHLLYQHNVHEKTCKSPEEFLTLFKGSCYLTCCSCEQMFTERDDFYDHQCKDSVTANAPNWNKDSVTLTPKEIKELAQKCSWCGVKCGHFRTCPKVVHKFPQNTPSSSYTNSTNTPNSNSSNLSLEKYYVPVPSNIQKNWAPNECDILKQVLSSMTHSEKDYYDVGNAASFCHVDIANDSDNASSPEKAKLDKSNVEHKCPNYKGHESSPKSHDISESQTKDYEDQQDSGSESLPNVYNNVNVNSVSDESDNPDGRLDSSGNEPIITCSDGESSNKDADDDDRMSTEENVDVKPTKEDLETIEEDKNKTEEKEINAESDTANEISEDSDDTTAENKLHTENQVATNYPNSNREEDNSHHSGGDYDKLHTENEVVSDGKLDQINENQLATNNPNSNGEEDTNSHHDGGGDNDKLQTENEGVSDCKLDKIAENQVATNYPNSNEDEDNSHHGDDNDNENDDNKLHTENEVVSDDCKLDKVDENPVATDYLNSNGEEDNSHEDDDDDEDNNSNTSCSSSNKSNMDIDCNDDKEENVKISEAIDDTENDKANNLIEDVRPPDEEPIDASLNDSSLNDKENISSLSNEDTSDNFENKNTIDRSDGNESEDSDKLSVVLSEEEEQQRKESPNGDDTDRNDDVPTDDEQHKDESLDNHSETDGTTQQTDKYGDDESHVLQENDTDNSVTMEESRNDEPRKESYFLCDGVNVQLANEEVMAMALTLEDKMDSLSSQSVVKECVRTSCSTCSYCSHAIKIAVNGKQLAIHLLTEHRYMPVKNETVEDIIDRLKRSLDELHDVWFNTDSYDSTDKSCFVPYDHTYECFQCNYVANTHKDLFSHKRKVHQKTILYCSMCKENFYSYSELLCHMCPGLYDASKDIQFRCCMCISDRIPSAFRLMVHLRKSHHTCDICLEIVDDQQKLSTHMVKHKLHHLCYRCGIAYRNKPDITKHLFWKHGTESVLCKKCLQKKWPHVYHFCIPPNSFICEECNISFSKAVYLKVHKRFHNNNLLYSCNSCEQKFVSKKLLIKHEKTHEAVTIDENVSNDTQPKSTDTDKNIEQNAMELGEPTITKKEESALPVQRTETPDKPDEVPAKPHKKKSKKDRERKIKPVVDVYDLPPLNLSSESDDTDDEKETKSVSSKIADKENDSSLSKPVDEELKTSELPKEIHIDNNNEESETKRTETPVENEENAQPVTVIDGIWDNFHTYKAEKEKRENLDIVNKQSILSQLDPSQPPVLSKESVLGDHDYCLLVNTPETEGQTDETDAAPETTKANEHSSSIDHDYCTQKADSVENTNATTGLLNTSNQSENTEVPTKRKQKSPKKKGTKHHNSSSSSDSSSDSDSSSCSCGTNCSCSSSSSNSSSSSSSDSDSSSSDGRNNNSNISTNSKREKKKERLKNKKKGEVAKPEPAAPPAEEPVVSVPIDLEEPLIRESDLETDETATDEDFYDQYPQMRANQILAEKRNQLMVLAAVAPTTNNGTASPPVPNTNSTNINLDPVGSPKLEIVTPPVAPVVQPQSKKRVKSKKRRKSSLGTTSRNRSANKQLSLSYETPQPSTSFSTQQWQSGHAKKPNDGSLYMQPQIQQTVATPVRNIGTVENTISSPVIGQQQQTHSTHSESNSSKRFSKRRRVRNKFYGYSSDEDGEHRQTNQPPLKWKKFSPVEGSVKHNTVYQQHPQSFQPVNAAQPEYNHSYQHSPAPLPPPPPPKIVPPTTIRTIYDDSQTSDGLTVKRTVISAPPSSDSSSDTDGDSDSDSNRLTINQQMNVTNIISASSNAGTSEKDDKLYCYCQCPYDEVSEMIACDGMDCAIEWFHFECVGIMVPPKGKWYCPDCRKRRGLS